MLRHRGKGGSPKGKEINGGGLRQGKGGTPLKHQKERRKKNEHHLFGKGGGVGEHLQFMCGKKTLFTGDRIQKKRGKKDMCLNGAGERGYGVR